MALWAPNSPKLHPRAQRSAWVQGSRQATRPNKPGAWHRACEGRCLSSFSLVLGSGVAVWGRGLAKTEACVHHHVCRTPLRPTRSPSHKVLQATAGTSDHPWISQQPLLVRCWHPAPEDPNLGPQRSRDVALTGAAAWLMFRSPTRISRLVAQLSLVSRRGQILAHFAIVNTPPFIDQSLSAPSAE